MGRRRLEKSSAAEPSIAGLLASLDAQPALHEALRHHEVLPAQSPRLAPLPAAFASLAPLLAARGIPALYEHQARALGHVAAGEHVVLATPTASGKTLVYTLPVLARAADAPEARALYLSPLKAPERDQHARLEADSAALPPGLYSLSRSRRRPRAGASPRVARNTTECVDHDRHAARHIRRRHGMGSVFRGLRTIVITPLYRGRLQIAQVLRRRRASPRVTARSRS